MDKLLRIKESHLEYTDATGTVHWSLPTALIVLISEYTTNEGPYLDDYFLVFVTAEENKLYFATCSFYAAGRDEVLSALQESLGSPMQLALQGSTEWRSRVMWPPEISENDYFEFTPVPTLTLAQKFTKRLLGPTYEYSISKLIREYLQSKIKSDK